MKLDVRILVVITCFLCIAASAVVIVRNVGKSSSSPFVEIIPPKGRAISNRPPSGLQLQVNATGITLTVPDCNTQEYQDKFFLHIYTDGINKKSSEDFVNMDFYLQQAVGKVTTPNEKKSCVVHKSFGDFPVREVGIGQFTTPNGKCCEITWSRFYVFDTNLPRQ